MNRETILNSIAEQFIEEVEETGLQDNGDAQDLLLNELLANYGLDIDEDYDEAVETIGRKLKEREESRA